jgi:hypothetical protein
LSWEEAKSFEAEEAGDLGPFGLDRPLYRIVLADDVKQEELLVGSVADDGEDGNHYVKMTGRPQIMTIKGRFIEELPSSEDDIRQEEPVEESEKTADAASERD